MLTKFKERNISTCCNAEVGTKVFAYFNLIVSCASCLASPVMLVYTIAAGDIFLPRAVTDSYYDSNGILTFILLVAVLIMSLLFSMIAVVFGGFLMSGVLKKKAEYLQAYFVYGIIVLSLSLLSVLCVLCFRWGRDPEQLVFVIPAFFTCIIYALILWMIKKTIILYQTLANQYEHTILYEKTPKTPLDIA